MPFITWQQAKEIIRKEWVGSFFLYNQTPLPTGTNTRGTKRNEICQMSVFHFVEFGQLKCEYHTIDTFSGFQWATALKFEKVESVMSKVMVIMGMPVQLRLTIP